MRLKHEAHRNLYSTLQAKTRSECPHCQESVLLLTKRKKKLFHVRIFKKWAK